jgi:hypothetical protein
MKDCSKEGFLIFVLVAKILFIGSFFISVPNLGQIGHIHTSAAPDIKCSPLTLPSSTSKRQKVGIFVFATHHVASEYAEELSSISCYSSLHGYLMFHETVELFPGRHHFFQRWEIVRQKYLPKVDWLLAIDADTRILNYSKTLEEFLPSRESNVSVLFSDRENGEIYAGAVFLRNVHSAYEFLESWLTYPDTQFANVDNGALMQKLAVDVEAYYRLNSSKCGGDYNTEFIPCIRKVINSRFLVRARLNLPILPTVYLYPLGRGFARSAEGRFLDPRVDKSNEQVYHKYLGCRFKTDFLGFGKQFHLSLTLSEMQCLGTSQSLTQEISTNMCEDSVKSALFCDRNFYVWGSYREDYMAFIGECKSQSV